MVDKASNLAWTTFGRYALLEKIGSGGMAEIYRAKTFGAAGFEKEFAIKLILPTLLDDTEFVNMFINEAKIAVSLYHANVVQVFDLGELDGQYYIAMEFVHGKDLLDVLARCAQSDMKIPLNIVLFLTMEFLKGLDFAHRAKNPYGEDLNIIHRDVSPSNVLISYAGDVKIGDFGVAKAAVQRNLTESGTLKGKVGYMSPEQVIGDEIDSRSDIFAAGIVFFEALSMNRLFIGNSDLDVMLRVRDADIDDPVQKAGPMPAQLEEIVRTALCKHREERYQTAGEFYQALMDFCYQHRIKVTGNDLSNFMRRLFADEIEAEKSKRKSEESQRDGQMAAVAAATAADRSGERPVFANRGKPQAESPRRDTDDYEELPESRVRPPAYRYRDEAGLIFGPMGEKTLVKLMRDRPPEADDRISVNGGEWVDPSEVEAVRDLVPVASNVAAAPIAVPAPASTEASYRDTIAQDPAEFEDSSPVMEEASVVTGPTTNEEAKQAIKEMREQYAAYTGKLSQASIARVLARLHRTGETGRLTVQRDEIEKSIYFERGEFVLVDSNKEDELLGSFLLSREIIVPAQLEEGLNRLSEWGGRLGDALVAIGAIPAHEIFTHLSNQMKEKILDVFTWEDGTWGYYENQQPETHGYPLGIEAYSTIVEGCIEHTPVDRIHAFYEARENRPMFLTDGPVSVEDLRLGTKAMRVVNQFKSGESLKGLLTTMPVQEAGLVYRVVYLLHQVEILRFEDTRAQDLPG